MPADCDHVPLTGSCTGSLSSGGPGWVPHRENCPHVAQLFVLRVKDLRQMVAADLVPDRQSAEYNV